MPVPPSNKTSIIKNCVSIAFLPLALCSISRKSISTRLNNDLIYVLIYMLSLALIYTVYFISKYSCYDFYGY